MDDQTVQRYLDRIDAPAPGEPTVDLLRNLHLRHLRAVPFENLSIHLGEPVTLDHDTLVDKIIDRRRGGFCYELNGLFGELLQALGFPVTLLSARVHTPVGTLTHPFDHLVPRVDLADRHLVDVGFGAHSSYPLRLDWPEPQADPSGEFLVVDAPNGDVDVLMDGTPQYRVEPRARSLSDFAPTCWWQQTSPDSHFTRSLTCSLPTEDGRVTLSGNRLITTVAGERTETTLDGDDTVRAAYRTHFGIELDRLPTPPRPAVVA
ncbi:MAG: arylamine N-acetyltransferase [Actinophytocola sp.]|uniref:arylamine N-acetyltransferase family protein n=1 Tax=Actinophytocola sp. TaxID=1872138 RepID=UPI0013234FEB|nr:arylamine N-acetyltransferase [Actinophytocola sp.]MPZ80727.1 arylamine N-acetyltransferase [Actinophytocola sp.]